MTHLDSHCFYRMLVLKIEHDIMFKNRHWRWAKNSWRTGSNWFQRSFDQLWLMTHLIVTAFYRMLKIEHDIMSKNRHWRCVIDQSHVRISQSGCGLGKQAQTCLPYHHFLNTPRVNHCVWIQKSSSIVYYIRTHLQMWISHLTDLVEWRLL